MSSTNSTAPSGGALYRFNEESPWHVYYIGIGTLLITFISLILWATRRSRLHTKTIFKAKQFELLALSAAFIVTIVLQIHDYGVWMPGPGQRSTPFQGAIAHGLIMCAFLYGVLSRHGPLIRSPIYVKQALAAAKRRMKRVDEALGNPVALNPVAFDPDDPTDPEIQTGHADYSAQRFIVFTFAAAFALCCAACVTDENSAYRAVLLVFATILAIIFAVVTTRQNNTIGFCLRFRKVYSIILTTAVSLWTALTVFLYWGLWTFSLDVNQYCAVHTVSFIVITSLAVVSTIVYDALQTDPSSVNSSDLEMLDKRLTQEQQQQQQMGNEAQVPLVSPAAALETSSASSESRQAAYGAVASTNAFTRLNMEQDMAHRRTQTTMSRTASALMTAFK
jgi:hypothetical protein